MKFFSRVFCLILSMILILSVGYAEQNLPRSQMVKRKELISAFSTSAYARWNIYFPSDSEDSSQNMLSTKFYKNTHFFPVVASNGDSLVFCILFRNRNGKWVLSRTNENALTRTDWILSAFSIDSSSFEEKSAGNMRLNFSFKSKSSDASYGISMEFNPSSAECNVVEYSIHDTQYPIESLGEYVIVRLLPDSILFRSFNMEILDFIDYELCNFSLDGDVEIFSLSDVPISPLDIMETYVLKDIMSDGNEQIPIFRSFDDEEPAFFLSPIEKVNCAISRLIGDIQYFVIEFDGRLGFIKKMKPSPLK